MAKLGRPKVKIDLNLVKSLAGIQCTIKEISAVMDIPASTLTSRPDFSLVYQKGLENGKASLRRIQYKLAEKSAGMAIFLGKQYLAQKDEQYLKGENMASRITIINHIPLTPKESEIKAQINGKNRNLSTPD